MTDNYGLDNWYRLINSIYFEANFYRDPESILTHLVEISGGLASISSGKSKPNVTEDAFIAKAIGWWSTLCGKVGVRSIEELIWAKYPFVCPYCLSEPHSSGICKRRGKHSEVDWDAVRELATKNRGRKPKTLRQWQEMFNKIYPRDESSDKQRIYARLAEEVGELAEAVRLLPIDHLYFMNEATDVFAWLMRLTNQMEDDRYIEEDQLGKMLEVSLNTEYPGHCKYCSKRPCKCPPVLPETFGRITKALPENIYPAGNISKLLSFKEAMDLFEEGARLLRIGEYTVTEVEIRQMVEKLGSVSVDLKNQGIQVSQLLDQVHQINSETLIQQESLDQLFVVLDHIKGKLDPEKKERVKEVISETLKSILPSLTQIVLKQLTGM